MQSEKEQDTFINSFITNSQSGKLQETINSHISSSKPFIYDSKSTVDSFNARHKGQNLD